MLKKKNIAMMMAVATAATTAAPAFAAVADQKDVIRTEGIQDFVKEVEAKFEMKYADVAENGDKRDTKVYTIQVNGDTIVEKSTTAGQITLADFKKAVDNMKNGEVIDVTITDYGHEERNGKIYANAIPEYKAEDGQIAELEFVSEPSGYSVNKTKKVVSDKEVAYTLEFKNNTTKDIEYTVTLANGDKQLDFKKPVIDKSNKLTGFENVDYAPVTPEDAVEKRLSKSTEKTVEVSSLFDGTNLTEAGQELAGLTFKANNYKTQDNKDRLEKADMDADKVIKEVKENEEYEMKLFIQNKSLARISDSLTQQGDLEELTITSSSKAVLVAFMTELKGYTPSEEAELIAGEDRFETAIEISKTKYKNTKAKNVVLVGENAIVDGLAAGPLASAKNAPILYTSKDSINAKTMDEISRVLGSVAGKTVYIVGGVDTISKDVVAQLEAKGINVKRIAGTDRVDTSLKIAEEIGTADHAENAFVIGYNGEADAMSVASIASKLDLNKVIPIVVSGLNGLTEDAKDYLDVKTNVTLVGGKSTLTGNVEEELKALDTKTVKRLAGEDRQDTNAKVIAEYFPTHTGDVYVSKAYALVDALAAAPSIDGAPMVLAGTTLTKSQENALELMGEAEDKKLYQVGNGIAKTVINKVINLIK